MRGDPTRQISDTALAMFVQWVELNQQQWTHDPILARAVLVAYAKNCPDAPVEPPAWIEVPLFHEDEVSA